MQTLSDEDLRKTQRELARKAGEAYDGGTTRCALLAVEELITLRERIVACAVNGEPLVKTLAPAPASSRELLTETAPEVPQ